MNYGGEISNSAEMREGESGVQYSQNINEQKMPTERLESSVSPNKGNGIFNQEMQENMTSSTHPRDVLVENIISQKENGDVSVVTTSSTLSTDSSELSIHNLKYDLIHETNLTDIFSYMRKTAKVRFSPVIAEPMDMRTSKSSPAVTSTRPLLILATTVLDSTVWNVSK